MSTGQQPKQRFAHHVGNEHDFVPQGLRGYFEYRDLGIGEASGGGHVAHVIRAKDGHQATGQWHYHDCDFQMYYVLRGSLTFEYEGQGIHTACAGDCVLQPPRIKHREIEHSADMELIEVVAPADFTTHDCDPPAD